MEENEWSRKGTELHQNASENAFQMKLVDAPIDDYDGYSALKAYLKHHKSQGLASVPRLMLKYVKTEVSSLPTGVPPSASSQNEITGVSFAYDDSPLPGWRRELVLRIGGKSSGRLDVIYTNPTRDKKFRNRSEVQAYFEQGTNAGAAGVGVGSSTSNEQAIDLFDFKVVFCICQCSEDPFRNYIECSFGKLGCNKWIHPECVGLGSRTKQELDTFPKVICPLCTTYIRGCKKEKFVPKNYRMLESFSPGYVFHDTYLSSGELIEETNCPHRIWGFTDFQKTFYGNAGVVGEMVTNRFMSGAESKSTEVEDFKATSSTATGAGMNTTTIQFLHSDKHISKWRRRIYDESKQSFISIGLVGGYVAGEDNQTDAELMKRRIQVRVREQANVRSIPMLPPNMRCKPVLDELICRSSLNQQLNKKRNSLTSKLYNVAPIAFNNLDDGGIRIITAISSSKSLHDLCKNGLCAMCFQPLASGEIAAGGNSAAPNARGKQSKHRQSEDPSFEENPISVPSTELCNFGAVSYELHRHCAFLLSKEEEFLQSIINEFPHLRPAVLSLDQVGEESFTSKYPILQTNCQDDGYSEYDCKLSRYYYDDIDDAKCYYCQKPGAVLFTWQASNHEYSLHLICLFSFIRKQWIQKWHVEKPLIQGIRSHQISPRETEMEVDNHIEGEELAATTAEIGAVNPEIQHPSIDINEQTKQSTSTLREQKEEQPADDHNDPKDEAASDSYHLCCRCMICGVHDGHVLRCCGANCHIRAHLLCASYTKEWKIITLHNPSLQAVFLALKKSMKAIGFVCSTHRIFDSTIEDEEDIGYFKK